jgi:hypothetical protein
MSSEPPMQPEERPADPARTAALADDLYCPECDYNLRGLTGERCPECGSALDWARLTTSQIPWVHRDKYGLLRGYWRTVWMVTFRRKRLANEIARPVGYLDSQKFRWISILHAYIALLVAAIVWFQSWAGPNTREMLADAGILPQVLLGVCALLCLVALTGVPGYWFHPKGMSVEKQNRAIALSYYSCGVLAWLPAALVLYGIARLLSSLSEEVNLLLLLCAALLPVLVVFLWWFGLVYLARRVLQPRRRRVWTFAFGLPPLWLGVTGLVLLGLPAAVLYVTLFFVSLAG